MDADPLKYYLAKYCPDTSLIKEMVFGDKYTAVMLTDGRIGVCANLDGKIKVDPGELGNMDLSNVSHRIAANAYLNAFLNYRNEYHDTKDIFDEVDFSIYQHIVMIGYFESLYHKLRAEGISASIFDIHKSDDQIKRMDEQLETVVQADAIILTATSLYNNTFQKIIRISKLKTDIFLLGPSSMLDTEMLNYRNMRYVFGSIFTRNDQQVLRLIQDGAGTKDFMPFMKKVYISKPLILKN